MSGRKDDASKRRWSLIPWEALGEIVDVLEYGARKYAVDNWMHVEDAEERYFDALMRHLTAHRSGETFDPETGLRHLAHAGCNVLFLLWFSVDPRDPLVVETTNDPFVVEGIEVISRRESPPQQLSAEAAPVKTFACEVCEDKHWVRVTRLGATVDLCCTSCPTPCPLCRGGDSYCKTTPCACPCHRKPT